MAFKVSSFLVTCVVSCPPKQMFLRVHLNVGFDRQKGKGAQCQTRKRTCQNSLSAGIISQDESIKVLSQLPPCAGSWWGLVRCLCHTLPWDPLE